MTENALTSDLQRRPDVWHVTFFMGYTPGALKPHHLRAEASHTDGQGDEYSWVHDGVATFDGPPMIPPKAGADLIPYLVYHLGELRDYLVAQHVEDVLTGTDRKVSPEVGEPVERPPFKIV